MNNRIKELRYVKASELAPDPRNPRRHPAAQRAALQSMLVDVGIADAVIARETSAGLVLIDGHLRADLDPDQILPVLVTDLDEAEAGKVLATLDPLAAMAGVDSGALARLIADSAPPIDLAAMFPDVDIAGILAPEPEALTDPDDVPELPVEPVSQRGDVWTLGRHRIMCGDSQDKADVDILLDGATPSLMVTDPPYGVNYDASWRNSGVLPYAATRIGKVGNDDSPEWGAAIPDCAEVIYAWSPPGDHAIIFGRIIQDAGFDLRNTIIWAKQTHVISRGHYHWRHELCWYGVRTGKTARWIGDRSQTTGWPISWDKNVEGGHSTQKPGECMERPIRNHEGDVYDPFVGSGTTIIAAERQGRACWAMELEPRYVDASVKRWEDYTGGQARRE